jgi:hypothetical protein
MNPGASTSLLGLSTDVLSIILEYLSVEDKLDLRLSCRAARELVDLLWQPLKGAFQWRHDDRGPFLCICFASHTQSIVCSFVGE